MKSRIWVGLFRCAAMTAFLFGWNVVGFAADDRTGFRVVESQTESGVILTMKSHYAREFTVTIKATLKNLVASRTLPFTTEAAGRSSFELVRFRVADKSKGWHFDYRYDWQVGGRGSLKRSDADYTIPFPAGVRPQVVQGALGAYSHYAGSGSEEAVDWDVPEGTTVCAAREGRVVAVRDDSTFTGSDPDLKPLGNYVVIKHADDTFAEYQHLQRGGALVKIGQEVKTGEPIAKSGNTGFSSGPHLHFAVFQTIDGKKRRTLPFRMKSHDGAVLQLARTRSE